VEVELGYDGERVSWVDIYKYTGKRGVM
jgi:hypothetical protein